MSNDYFKAQGWFKNYALNSQDSRGMFQRLVKEDEEAFKLASAETDRIKDMINEKFGPGTMKPASELPPIQNPFEDFEERNPAAEGGRMRFNDGLSAKQKKALTITYPKDATKDLEIKKTSNNALSAKRKLDIIKFVTDFKEKNNRLPTRNEIRIDGKFDYQFIKDRIDDGSIETLSTSEAKKLGRKKVDLKEIGKKTSATKTKNQPYVVTEGASQTVGDVLDIKFPNEEMKNNYLEDLKKIYNEGYRRTIYKDPGVLTTKELAEKYFGKANDFTISKIGKMNTFFANQLGLSFENLPIETKSQEVAERRKEKITKGRKELTDREKLINTQQDNLVSEINKYYKEFPDEVINNKELTNAILSRMNDDGTVKLKTFDSEIEKNKYLKKMALSKSGVMSIDHLSDVKFGKKNVEFPINRQLIPTKTNQSIITKAKSLLSKNLNKTDEASQAIVKNVLNTLNNLGQRVNVDGKIYGADILAAIDETKGTLPNMERSITKFNLNDVVNNSNFKINPSLIKTSNIDYIGGKKDFVGFSSGFNTDLLMKDPAVQKILNSKAGQAVKNAARGTAGTVGKVFGGIDIVIGALDYENNKSKGQKHDEALGNAVQAMSFGLYKSGDRARVKEVKDIFVKNGGDGEIFDQATALNAKDQEINDLIFDSKKKADTFVRYAKEGRGVLTPDLEKSKSDYNVLKKNLNEEIKNKIQERDSMVESYKTNLRVSEAGAPIQIGGNEFFSQPFKDIKQSTMDKIAEENRKAYDMQKRQVNFTSGNIGNFLQNNIFTMSPQEKAELQKQINNMDERELYKFNLSRGMDPDNLIRFEDILRYKTNDPALMGVNTTKYVNYDDRKAEGGITELRSKYEYKK